MSWTYHGYWQLVLGAKPGAGEDVVREYDIEPDTDIEEWLRDREIEAWARSGAGGELPAEWARYRTTALKELRRALE